jgi:hypothetical protein
MEDAAMPFLRALGLALSAGALAACQSPDEADYSDRYRPSQLERVADASLLAATPEEIAAARAEDRAIYRAELRRQTMLAGSLAGLQSARRGAQIQRQAQTSDRARTRLVWAERDLARAQRELRAAERLDRRPVGSGPRDRADALRRMEETEARRSLDRARQAERAAAQSADRLGRLGAAGSASERLQTLDRIERREAERAQAARGEPDPLQRYLPYRRTGESVEALRTRVEAAEARAAETGTPVESILRRQRE